MTRLITRYFERADAAHDAARHLVFEARLSQRIVQVLEGAERAASEMDRAGVLPETISAYKEKLATGGAVLVVKAGYKPLCVAKIARTVLAEMGAADMGELTEEVKVKDQARPLLSIFPDHPTFLQIPKDPSPSNARMANFPLPLISRRKPYAASLIRPHAHMANFPIPLISSRTPYDDTIFDSKHVRMADFGLPLLSARKPRDRFVFPRHARMARFPLPLLSRRIPFAASWIGRHARMANWPFPHLMTRSLGDNTLMPGGPRMANFPIRLISRRRPITASIFSRHARMARFPIPLISRRTPKDRFAFPRHARMGDKFLPLIIGHAAFEEGSERETYSLSKAFGLPLLTRR